MANLPDIDTSQVGVIAFWNADDHKDAGVVDPTDCTGVFTNYSVYDNGLDGNISLGSGRLFNCRVKNDGWCVAWVDRTNTFDYPTKVAADFGESAAKGYYDILWNWFDHTANISSSLTTLSYVISLFEAALETSGDFTFSANDVGHYCYEFTSANVLTLLSLQGSADTTGKIQYTAGTTLYHASVAGSASWGGVVFASNEIIFTVDGINKYCAVDILSNDWMPDSLTDYSLRIYGSQSRNASVLILWS